MGKSDKSFVAHTDFPPYSIESFGGNHFVVAGGGGPAKTGIPNVIETLEIVNCDKSHIEYASLERTMTDDFPESEHEAVMNGAVSSWSPRDRSAFYATGMNNKCFVFEVFKEPQKSAKLIGTVTSEGENGYQTSVCWAYDNKSFVTAGSTGKICVWSFPDLKLKHTIKAHKTDIEGLTCCPVDLQAVTCSRDGSMKQLDIAKGTIINDLFWTSNPEQIKAYRCRACSYGIVNHDKTLVRLYSIHIPKVMKTKLKQPVFLVRWDSRLLPDRKALLNKDDTASCIKISPCGNFVGIGSLEGNVSIYIAFSLKCVKRVVAVHENFITSLCFAPVTFSDKPGAIMQSRVFLDYEALLFSVSIDKTVNMVGLRERSSMSVMVALILVMLVICFVGIGIGIGAAL